MYENYYKLIVPKWIPTRAIICIMLFTACYTSYVCRLQMPILVVRMINTNTTAINDNNDLKNEFSLFSGKPYPWSAHIRGQLIAAYSYGNVPGNFIGGVAALKYGPYKAIFWSSLLAALLCLITPLLAHVHYGLLIVARIIVGLTGGVTFPACHTMVANWAPPDEKSRFIWSLQGGSLGTIVAMPMISALGEYLNWETGWYLPSLLMFIWIFFWFILVYDTPADHPGITEKERDYILQSQQLAVGQRKQRSLKETPILSIMASIPFLCLILCHFGNLFLLFFYQNSMLLYLTQALNINFTKGGFMSAMPPLGRMVFGFFFSWIGDTLKKNKIISVVALRKIGSIFSHFIPGCFLILVGYMGKNLALINTFLVLALSFNGAAVIVNLSNNQDLSPNYAGFLYGIMNTIGTSAGIIGPIMVEAIAGSRGNTIEQWQLVFWIGAGICFLSMMAFILGGSGEVQKWNDYDEPDRENH